MYEHYTLDDRSNLRETTSAFNRTGNSPIPHVTLRAGQAILASTAIALLLLNSSPAKADNCSLMLQPVFQFIKQNPGGDLPATVRATVTKHHASKSLDATQDVVR